MERIGVARRLPAAILDWVILGIFVTAGIVIYASVGGTRLGLEAQREMGMPITTSTVVSGEAWEAYGREAEEIVAEIERMVEEDFTPAQLDAMGEVLEDHWEGKLPVDGQFRREDLPIDFILKMDENSLNEAIDESFDAIIAAENADIPTAQVNALRDEVKTVVNEFGAAVLLPKIIRFIVWMLFLPTVITLAYGLIEGIFGRSLGKLITGIAIRKDGGERAYVSNLLLRYAIKYSPQLLMILALLLRSPGVAIASGVAGVVVFIGMLVMIGPEKRAVYDFIAGTAVYRASEVVDE